MKQPSHDPFSEYKEILSAEGLEELKDFFAEFDTHCLVRGKEKKKLKTDFEKAVLYYADSGISQSKALSLLDIKNLGGFYARPPILWFPLDDAAKNLPFIYGAWQNVGISSIGIFEESGCS